MTVTSAAAFLGQVALECNEWQQMHEVGNNDRYHGRGFIQLTGIMNYRLAGMDLGLDLVGNPDLACDYANAAKIAVWYWTTNKINPVAESGDFRHVTRIINGGYNGLEQRLAYTHKALAVLGAGVPIP